MMTIDLAPFCSTNPYRPDLSQPFRYGDKTYATDVHHIILELELLDYPSAIIKDTPNPLRVLDDGITKQEWDSCSPHDAIDLGTPPELGACKNCDGEGEGYHTCPHCTCLCDDCGGSGKSGPLGLGSTNIGAAIFDQHYIRLIQSLPGLQTPSRSKKHARGPMPFKFEGGRGALMPQSVKHQANHVPGR